MVEKKIVIKNKTGLHARPATELVELSSKFESDVLIYTDEEEIDAKSIISVLSGGVFPGAEITLQVTGTDEDVASEKIIYLLENLMD